MLFRTCLIAVLLSACSRVEITNEQPPATNTQQPNKPNQPTTQKQQVEKSAQDLSVGLTKFSEALKRRFLENSPIANATTGYRTSLQNFTNELPNYQPSELAGIYKWVPVRHGEFFDTFYKQPAISTDQELYQLFDQICKNFQALDKLMSAAQTNQPSY